jgi:cytochrome c peroxidase
MSPGSHSPRARLAIALSAVVLLFVSTRGADKPAAADVRSPSSLNSRNPNSVDRLLSALLDRHGFTGRIESQLERRLGRRLDPRKAELGRLLWFDTITGLHDDNTCAGCHSPTAGFGDTQPIAIGVQNNGIVGPSRTGPRNQRRSPLVINTAFYPKLMWNGRFFAPSGNPFDNSGGFVFPEPEGETQFPPNDPIIKHLLQAQAFIPPTEQIEVAGFTGTGGPFDDGLGQPVPDPDHTGFRNEPIRQAVLTRLNAIPEYRRRFGIAFPAVRRGAPITFDMFGRAIAEFEFTLTFANAPIDRFARGQRNAMTLSQKRGAILFFGRAGCVSCHAVGGRSNEMFSDFRDHCIGVPQVFPLFGPGTGNFAFVGPGENEDFGAADLTGLQRDRYKFRTSPLRNIALQPAFFHNGAFTRLEDAIAHHLDVHRSARTYDPARAGLPPDLHQTGPIEPVLARLDPGVAQPRRLTTQEFNDLVAFVRFGLLDSRALPQNLRRLIPSTVPSGRPVLLFE